MKANLTAALAALIFILAAGDAAAQNRAPAPVQAALGIYLNQIYDVSLKDNKFAVDFWIWFRWKKAGINPAETFEVVGGRVESADPIEVTFDRATGQYYTSVRVNAVITKFWDISRFPLDDHLLQITIEDSEYDSSALVYLPDTVNCGMEPGVQVPGWTLGALKAEAADHVYQTNYGDPALPPGNESAYSRFVFSVNLNRPGLGYFVKLFFTVFIATLIAFMTLFIKPTDLDPRFGLGAGALFAAVASEMVIASTLPDTNVITLTDKLHIIAIFFIFLSIVESVVSLRVFTRGEEEFSRKLDKVSLATFLAVYLTASFLFVVFR